MFLHAHQLTLPHPLTGETLRLTADLPPACLKLLKQLETA
ncbi:ribosomal large subunit pseudouridine synthase C [Bordetella pertussis]|nr:ribosomal large subunit pseudouridine synthase C [Bordetella pertussis]CPM29088.1 ribosomal large subunit pseudouridine synthase C [Bordetella pertussis]CPM78610.1 ribosomal large subunit pseudouridine synthase C [Bordetella pertussis]CPN68265.1 ribosomal large subunit pseudouridine synthase C [Bordetella pertussis]CPO36696.1 ribosomal large subunit pseudouridine synthase C [Bordetella pertussis]